MRRYTPPHRRRARPGPPPPAVPRQRSWPARAPGAAPPPGPAGAGGGRGAAGGGRRFCARWGGGKQPPRRYFVAFLEFDGIDDAAHRRWHVHRGLLGLERYQRIVDADLAAFFDEDIDDIDTLGITEIRNPHLDDAHSNALTSPSTLARNTTKRAASAPSITRWS